MARPTRCRRICTEPAYDRFIPCGIAGGEGVLLTLDEYECIRLMDLENLTQEQWTGLVMPQPFTHRSGGRNSGRLTVVSRDPNLLKSVPLSAIRALANPF